MAKAVALVSALCILAFATVAHCHAPEVFDVEGYVYCDPCRVQFETKLSHKIAGATLKLECSDPITRNVTYSIEGVTDSNGHYKLKVKGDYGDNICEVTLNKSPEAECNVPMVGQQTSRIVCTENSGMHDSVRYANALGFMTKNSISGCKEVLDELGLAPKDLDL
ncbi:anther-specific LAT52-like [Olea europaea subsp. europaea]|uniref:Anther-specific LAT52-like n=1 Tax=Olea europaea subsp. europaea TaxID=158383 RepID=A0A8S0R3N8_OLEEU|nr:anther-specific LAT52-like [Olea europaea subsp. europaea]